MKTYATLKEVFAEMSQLTWEGTFFVNHSAWRASPAQTRFIFLTGDDNLEDIVEGEASLPLLAKENNVRYFLDFQVFDDIILKQRKIDPESTLNEFIYALNY